MSRSSTLCRAAVAACALAVLGFVPGASHAASGAKAAARASSQPQLAHPAAERVTKPAFQVDPAKATMLALPDLTISISAPNGANAPLSFEVRNTGLGKAGAFQIELRYISACEAGKAQSSPVFGGFPIGGLQAGQTVGGAWLPPGGFTSPGCYTWIRATVDPHGTVPERNEKNNRVYGDFCLSETCY